MNIVVKVNVRFTVPKLGTGLRFVREGVRVSDRLGIGLALGNYGYG